MPVGEAGNLYTSVGMYLTSFSHYGVQLGGPFVQVTYRLDAMPTAQQAYHDETGYYIYIPIEVVESTYFVPGSTVGQGEYTRPHENVNIVGGRVYLNVPTGNTHTVRFYGYNNALLSTQQVPHGQGAQAPNAPDVSDSQGLHRFFRWDRDFSNVTQDIDVHAEYVLMGDANSDGHVDSSDALLALRKSLGMLNLGDAACFAADVNSDGTVNSSDALLILRYSLGIILNF